MIEVKSTEHYDQHESNGNAATKDIVEFTGAVNADWLWDTLAKALKKSQEAKK